jgi:integrase
LEGVTVHVLRHSFAATAAGIGYSELTIAGLLGHSVPGVMARYAHVPTPLSFRRLTGSLRRSRLEGGNVVPMRVAS